MRKTVNVKHNFILVMIMVEQERSTVISLMVLWFIVIMNLISIGPMAVD